MQSAKQNAAGQKQTADKIFLRGLRLSCLIGVDAAEQYCRQAIVMDVDIISLPSPDGADFVPPVDYAILVRRLREWAEAKQHRYLEEFAAAAADLVIAEFAVSQVRVSCCKLRPFAGLEQFAAEAHRAKS